MRESELFQFFLYTCRSNDLVHAGIVLSLSACLYVCRTWSRELNPASTVFICTRYKCSYLACIFLAPNILGEFDTGISWFHLLQTLFFWTSINWPYFSASESFRQIITVLVSSAWAGWLMEITSQLSVSVALYCVSCLSRQHMFLEQTCFSEQLCWRNHC